MKAGKIVAPLFQKLDPLKKEMQSIVLAPTHELVVQILRQIERLSANSELKITSTSAIGNVNIDRQIDKLKEKPHIIVGTPGRILELIKKKKISAHTLKTIIIDEADKLVDFDNIETAREIIKSTQKDRQILMVSASITKETEARAKELMKSPVFIRDSSSATVPETISHACFLSDRRDKIEVLMKVVGILKPKKALVFIGEREEADVITEKLQYHGVNAAAIHGEVRKLERKKAMDDFKSGKVQLLVTSDIAARGLDIEGLTHIFNLNIPENSKEYLHRVGRTGRNGNSGLAISIATEHELSFIVQFQKELKIRIDPKALYKGKIYDADMGR